jgi:hypothetical protein
MNPLLPPRVVDVETRPEDTAACWRRTSQAIQVFSVDSLLEHLDTWERLRRFRRD